MAFRSAIISALAAPVFLLSACATPARQSSQETISISRGLWYASWCVSTCFGPGKITVSPNGDVTDEFAGNVQRSHITAVEAAEFRSTLAPYRPGGNSPPAITCELHTGFKYTAPYSYRRRLTQLELTWSDRNRTLRLVACDTTENAGLSNAISRALKLLHLGY